ncbi:uncharacterized protein LOC131215990 [Anopheles bellator]|uniref:uncharacterized protein LOC131215990 n=1 Tax=Anopheles bellator TaxID=139047 RepID=UPI002647CC14|nr:uncharacterized protein LOC131215990 [Anopheles bellator]
MFSRFQQWCKKEKATCGLFRWRGCVNLPETSPDFAACDPFDLPPELRRHSLPRRMLGNFLSERNIPYEAEQKSLKRLLKEHGLYNKHQTLQQRRRLRYLLQVERQAFVGGDQDECGDHCHSLDYTQPNTGSASARDAIQTKPGPSKCVKLQTIVSTKPTTTPIVEMVDSAQRMRRTQSMTLTGDTELGAIPPTEGCSESTHILHVVQAEVVPRNSQCLETSI